MKIVLKFIVTAALTVVLMKVIYLFPWSQALMGSSSGQNLHVWLASRFNVHGVEQAENMWMVIWFAISLLVSSFIVFFMFRKKV